MISSNRIYRIVVAVVVGLVVLGLSTSIGRDRKNYEVETQVYGVPVAQSDAARAIDAYERVMDRHMDLMERNLTEFAADLKVLTVKVDAVDAKLTQLDQRLARIERHLGIVPPSPRPDPNAPPAPPVPARNLSSVQP